MYILSVRCPCANLVGPQGIRHLGLAKFQSSLLPLHELSDKHTWPLELMLYGA